MSTSFAGFFVRAHEWTCLDCLSSHSCFVTNAPGRISLDGAPPHPAKHFLLRSESNKNTCSCWFVPFRLYGASPWLEDREVKDPHPPRAQCLKGLRSPWLRSLDQQEIWTIILTVMSSRERSRGKRVLRKQLAPLTNTQALRMT